MAGMWLMKSEPDEFSIDDLARVGAEPWTGVRNYQARNYMRDGMQINDPVLFYHSNCATPGIVGIARVVSPARPDPSQFDPESGYFDPAAKADAPRWLLVEIAFVRKLQRSIRLDTLRAHAEQLGDLALLRRGNRLSVLPVSATQYKTILTMERCSP